MELIILAAGTGSRLWPLTRHVPKSLLDLGDGRCMLERQLENARRAGNVDHVSVVTGYRAAQVEARLRQTNPGIAVSTIFNPVYKLTNNLMSLWFALPVMQARDVIITNGDNLYKASVLPAVTAGEDGIWLTIDQKQSYDDDDMKVSLNSDGTVRLVGKTIPPEETNAESVGLVVVRGERFRRIFTAEVDRLIRSEENLSQFWLEVFNSLSRNGHLVRTVEIPAESWVEVDFHPDVNRLRKSITDKIEWND